jgi:WD40 repeat protein
VQGIQFSPNGRLMASGDRQGLVIVWSVADGQLRSIAQFEQNGVVKNVLFSPDSSTLAIGSSTERGPEITLWDVSDPAAILGMNIPLGIDSLDLYGLAFSSDGQMLAMGSGAGDITLWDMSVASWQARSCALAQRNLTENEWLRYFGDAPYHPTCG